jgi:hypothetical protein
MKWEKLAVIAEIVSSIAILATLAYLAVQTQQNANALLAISRQATMEGEVALLSSMIAYPVDFGTEIDRSDNEALRFSTFLLLALKVREFAWFQYQAGLLDEATWRSYMEPVPFMFSTRSARRVLNNFGGDPAFKAYLLEWIEQNP